MYIHWVCRLSLHVYDWPDSACSPRCHCPHSTPGISPPLTYTQGPQGLSQRSPQCGLIKKTVFNRANSQKSHIGIHRKYLDVHWQSPGVLSVAKILVILVQNKLKLNTKGASKTRNWEILNSQIQIYCLLSISYELDWHVS